MRTVATPKQWRRRRRGSLLLLTVVGALIAVAVALAGTGLDSGDVGIVGSAGTSPSGATLVRGDSTTFGLSITADNGNFPSNSSSCDSVKAGVTSPTGFSVTSTGLATSGSTSQSFTCNGNNLNTTPQYMTFSGLVLSASATAPLGRSDYAITFGSGQMVTFGSQISLDAGFTNPRVYVTVNPRPASNLQASAVSTSEIDVSWTASPDAADISNYVLESSPDGSTNWASLATPNKADTTYPNTGLDPSTQRCYRILARYNDGSNNFDSTWVPASGTVCATTLAGATYTIDGFYKPIDNLPTVNGAKAGSTIPIKFNVLLRGVIQSDTSLVHTIIQTTPCTAGADTDMLTTAELSSGNTTLRFDSTAQQMIFNWKTPKTPGCYLVTINVTDATPLTAKFLLK